MEKNIKTNCVPPHQDGAFKHKHRMLKHFQNSPNLGLLIRDYDAHNSPQIFVSTKILEELDSRGNKKKNYI